MGLVVGLHIQKLSLEPYSATLKGGDYLCLGSQVGGVMEGSLINPVSHKIIDLENPITSHDAFIPSGKQPYPSEHGT